MSGEVTKYLDTPCCLDTEYYRNKVAICIYMFIQCLYLPWQPPVAGHYYDTAGYVLWDKSNKINNPNFACRQFQWEDQLQTVPACRCVTS